jgi:phage terminase large subunit-like protein
VTDDVVTAYARQVVAGEVPAGKYHRLACARHLRDLERQGTPDFPYRFELPRAERFFRFAEQLRHYKGEWAGTCIRLTPYQKFRLGSIFGWVHVETGLRRFRTAYNEIPRKQGKSLEAAIVALYVVFFDGEPGAEGYTIATKKDQAKIVFNDAKKLVRSSGLKKRIGGSGQKHQPLYRDATESKLDALGADADSTDGLNPNLIITDEFHKHKDRALIDVMETATGARRQPLHFQITTAGDDPVSPCGDQHDYACKILEGVLVDETFFAFIAHADLEDDWQSEATWKKANPHWNISIKPDDMRALAVKAKGIPAAAATFKQKRLNLWVNSAAPCLSVDGWRAGQSEWTEAEMEGQACFVGVDLASQIDLCALSFVFPPTPARPRWRILQRIWTPEETVKARAHRDRAPYDVWIEQGWLTASPGTSLDHDVVRQAILAGRQRFQIVQVGFDPWHADQPIKRLTTEDGFAETAVIAVPQTFAGMSAACLKVQAEILAGKFDARGCPVTTWSVSNVVDQRDGKDNLMFSKKRSRGRIDPVISATIGVALSLHQELVTEPQFQMMILGGGKKR